jgi:two-component system, sensor histidine kinase PdtaS
MSNKNFLLLLLLIQSHLIAFTQIRKEQQAPALNNLGKDTAEVLRLLQQGNAELEIGRDFSKVIWYAQQADSLSQRIGYTRGMGESALLMAGYFRQFNKFEEAMTVLTKAERIFDQLHLENSLAKTYSLRGAVDTNLSVREVYYEKALSILKANGNKKEIAAILPGYSEVKMIQGQLPAAENMLKESIQLSKELGIERIHWRYGLLGAVQTQMRNLVEALKNELMAVKIGEQYEDTSSRMAEIYNYAAIIYFKMGMLDESRQYLYKAIGTGLQDPGLTVQVLSNLANILIRLNKPKEALDNLIILEKKYEKEIPLNAKIQMYSRFVRCYTDINDLTNAGRYAEQLMKYSDGMKPDEYDQFMIYPELNRFLIVNGQYEKARRFVEQQRLIAEKFKSPDQRTTSFLYRYKIDSASGDMTSALNYFKLYTKGKDSVLNDNIAKQLNQLHVEFETEKKDKELLLKENNIKILTQEASLQKVLSEKNARELAYNRQTLELKQKDLLNEKQQVDLLSNQTQLQNIANEKQRQELVIKQQDITLLKQSNRIQESDLKRASIIRNVIIAGALVLGLISILIYGRYRMKKRLSEELALQREEIRKKNDHLQELIGDKDKLLTEKEWWLKEVHHRVKNNLHTIICLLESQAMYLEKDALQAIEKSQHRIYAMSLIHQKLYQDEDVKSIDMSVYLDEFVQYLRDSFEADRIEFVREVEPIQLNLTQAIPVGLIINEAVTNSIKYAFPDPADARIFVSMNEKAGIVNLTIADNGKGFTPTEEAETKSLGIQLIKGLSKEIRASLSIKGDNGTKVAIQFKKDIITSTEQIMHKELANYEA